MHMCDKNSDTAIVVSDKEIRIFRNLSVYSNNIFTYL